MNVRRSRVWFIGHLSAAVLLCCSQMVAAEEVAADEISSLAARVQRLEDVEAIRVLMSRYASAINQGWGGRHVDPGAAAEIFAPDARWSSGDMGIEVVGISAIAESLRVSTADIQFAQHVFLNPTILVDGDQATASWLMWIAVRRARGSQLVYLSEEVQYQRTANGWRITILDLQVAGGNLFPQAD
jgi:hypothetical protein